MPHSKKPSGRRMGHRTGRSAPRAVRVRPNPPILITDTADLLGDRERAAIEREARKLSEFSDRIVEIHVRVAAPHRRLHREVVRYQVLLRIAVPMEELTVEHQEDVNLLIATRQAFEAGRRLLQDYVRRHQSPPAAMEHPAEGRVVQLPPNEEYGFIEGANGEAIYFHRNSVVGASFDKLAVGQPVRYVAESGLEGLQASTVMPGGRG